MVWNGGVGSNRMDGIHSVHSEHLWDRVCAGADLVEAWMTCKHCCDDFKIYDCPHCWVRVETACEECHNELVHGILPRVTDSKPRISHGPWNEPGPAWENAVRALEEGR